MYLRVCHGMFVQEKEGNVAGVVYVTSALPNSTPVNLAGRPMVASASEAKK
jgi:hypothetical protein